MEKVNKLYKELQGKRNLLIELFENEQKKRLIEFLKEADYEKVSNLDNYNFYKTMMIMINEIKEIDIKLRTLRAIIK